MERYRAAVDEAVATRKQRDTRTLEEKSLYEQSFIQCQYIWEDFPDIRGLTFHPRVGAIAAALTGATRVRLWHDQALYKEAGGRETEAHQDQPYWPIAERDTVTVWTPLSEVDGRSGCMGYVPGSHLGEAEFIDIFNTPGDGKRLQEKFASTPPVFVPCSPGDVIFHSGFTVHMAKANQSDRTRRVYTAIYFRDGCTRAGDARASIGGSHRNSDRQRDRRPCDADRLAARRRPVSAAGPVARSRHGEADPCTAARHHSAQLTPWPPTSRSASPAQASFTPTRKIPTSTRAFAG